MEFIGDETRFEIPEAAVLAIGNMSEAELALFIREMRKHAYITQLRSGDKESKGE